MSPLRLSCLIAAGLAVGCIDPHPDKGAESPVPVEGAADSFQRPTEHGAIGFDAPAAARLTRDQLHHTWTFSLTGDAEVDLVTGPVRAGGPQVDTVLYLYQRRAAGNWGSYLARNDDADGTLWSSLTRRLGAGEYRVLVKGYAAHTRGRFGVTVGCAGAGCLEPSDDRCLLGDTYHELLADPGFARLYATRLYDASTLTDLERDQVILAVHQSSHTDVVTVEEAFARIDQGELVVTELQHRVTGQAFRLYEYGAGDNSYGGVFYQGTMALAASIHDGDLLGCDFVARPGGAPQGALCSGAPGACIAGLTCQGVTAGHGVCVPSGSIDGEGDGCTSDPGCGDARLICAGLTRGGDGLCLPVWMRGTFDDVAGAAPIPDGGTLTRHLTAFGLTSVDMDVELRATIAHPRASELRIYLRNPAGAEVLVWDGPARGAGADADPVLELDRPVYFSGDEQVNGSWTLRLVDRVAGHTGTLSSWHLTVTSRWD